MTVKQQKRPICTNFLTKEELMADPNFIKTVHYYHYPHFYTDLKHLQVKYEFMIDLLEINKVQLKFEK